MSIKAHQNKKQERTISAETDANVCFNYFRLTFYGLTTFTLTQKQVSSLALLQPHIELIVLTSFYQIIIL